MQPRSLSGSTIVPRDYVWLHDFSDLMSCNEHLMELVCLHLDTPDKDELSNSGWFTIHDTGENSVVVPHPLSIVYRVVRVSASNPEWVSGIPEGQTHEGVQASRLTNSLPRTLFANVPLHPSPTLKSPDYASLRHLNKFDS